MSWVAVFTLCGAAYALKALGAMAASRAAAARRAGRATRSPRRPRPRRPHRRPDDRPRPDLVLDARLPALLVAGALIWRGAPLLVVVLGAGATAAVLHGA